MFIHRIKNNDKRDTQFNFEKFIFNNNYIFKKSIIIENSENFSITYEKRKNEIFELIFDSNRANDDVKIKIYYKFRERKI